MSVCVAHHLCDDSFSNPHPPNSNSCVLCNISQRRAQSQLQREREGARASIRFKNPIMRKTIKLQHLSAENLSKHNVRPHYSPCGRESQAENIYGRLRMQTTRAFHNHGAHESDLATGTATVECARIWSVRFKYIIRTKSALAADHRRRFKCFRMLLWFPHKIAQNTQSHCERHLCTHKSLCADCVQLQHAAWLV